MSAREKRLALIVGALLFVVLLAWGWYLFDEADRFRTDRIRTLQSQIDEQDRLVGEGGKAARRLAEYAQRSLPPQANVARSLYKAWLLDLAEKDVGIAEPVVTPGAVTPVGGVYERISFNVSGRATLPQLTKLLHEFYAVNYLHQIRALRVKPIPESRELEVSLAIDAVVLPTAKEVKQLAPEKTAELAYGDMAAYQKTILGRNLFGPVNHPPKLSRIGSQEVRTDRSLSITAKASDPDPLDKVTFRLEDAPPGAEISSDGKLSYRPKEVGTYSLTVVAVDDGLPPQEARETVQIKVVKPPPPMVTRVDTGPPPPPKPRFEDAKFAYVTAITEVDGERQVWLTIRTSGELLKLREGEKFEVEKFKGTISRLGVQAVEVTAGEESRLYQLGESLAQGQPLAAGSARNSRE